MSKDVLFLLRGYSSFLLGRSHLAGKNGSKFFWKVYSAILVCLVLFLAGVSFAKKSESVYGKVSYLNTFLDVLLCTAMTFLNVCSIIVPNFFETKSLVKIEGVIIKLDSISDEKRTETARKLKKFIYIEQAFNWTILITFLMVFLMDEYTHNGLDVTFVSNYVSFIFMNLSVSRIYIFMLSLKCSINNVNALITRTMASKEVLSVINSCDAILSAVDSLNKAFGLEIFCIIGISEIVLIQTIVIHQELESHLSYAAYVVSILRYTLIIIYDIEIAFAASQISDSLRAAGYLAINSISKCPKGVKNYESIVNGFQLIANQVRCRNIHITAGGYFVVDRSLVFKVFGQVSSYIIVVLQLQKLF